MNKGLNKAYTALFASGLLAVAAVVGLTGGTSGAANAAVPGMGSAPVVQAAVVPQESWAAPFNVSQSCLYDNTPWVGASPLDGGVTVGWEQRDVSANQNNL